MNRDDPSPVGERTTPILGAVTVFAPSAMITMSGARHLSVLALSAAVALALMPSLAVAQTHEQAATAPRQDQPATARQDPTARPLNFEAPGEKTVCTIGGEHRAERGLGKGAGLGHEADRREGADEHCGDQPSEALQQRRERWPGRHLPDVGGERRDHHQHCRLRRRHDDAEEAHHHGRQADADRALDEAGEKKGDGDEDERCRAIGHYFAGITRAGASMRITLV